jgi:hypothetical protein
MFLRKCPCGWLVCGWYDTRYEDDAFSLVLFTILKKYPKVATKQSARCFYRTVAISDKLPRLITLSWIGVVETYSAAETVHFLVFECLAFSPCTSVRLHHTKTSNRAIPNYFTRYINRY